MRVPQASHRCVICSGRGFISYKGEPCERCNGDAYHQAQKEKAMAKTGIPNRFINATLDTYIPKNKTQETAIVVLKEYVNDLANMLERGIGITLHGAVGTGKTHLAVAILSVAISKLYSVHFAAEDTIFDNFKENWREPEKEIQYLIKLQKVRFLVIDDIGIRRPSDYVSDRYEAIFNTRYANGLPTIITTNKSPAELKEVYERQMSRLAGNYTLEVLGPDRRQAQ